MSQTHSIFILVILVATNLCTPAGAGPLSPTQIVIRADYLGWSSATTNLTLTLSNGVYAAGTYTVAPTLISNLMAVAKRPWPQPGTNAWPRFTIDLSNLGFNAAWVKSNYQLLLDAYSGDAGKGLFPNASERQRVWLTNALADVELLGEAVRGRFGTMWTDDDPSLELRFENDDGQVVKQVFRLSTRAQPPFMLPWEVYDGTNEFTSGNADISRAVVQVLPPGFMHRDRLNGNLLQMVVGGFLNLGEVLEFIKKSTLEETLGKGADLLHQGFEAQNSGIDAGSYIGFPGGFRATLHRTNWPDRLNMPILTGIEHGAVTNLNTILGNAEARVAPLLKQEWLMSRLKVSASVSIEVEPEGSPDHPWLRGHMEKVGRAAFYDRIQPSLRRSLGFVLHEGKERTSEWAVLEDGRLLLYGFTGNGILDWKPDELGLQGEQRML